MWNSNLVLTYIQLKNYTSRGVSPDHSTAVTLSKSYTENRLLQLNHLLMYVTVTYLPSWKVKAYM